MYPCVLSATIEPGLMDEPCDWDVCTQASAPFTHIFSRKHKKKCAKSEVPVSSSVEDEAVEHGIEGKLEKTHPAPRRGARREGSPKRVAPVKETQNPPEAAPTRKELQDALPKIPPLSSFKSCKSRFVTLEEAEQDFVSFITTGLGRSVEVIREFRGPEEDGHSDEKQRESVTLDDDGAQSLTQSVNRWKSNESHPRSVSISSSSRGSQSDMEDDETVGSSDQSPAGERRAVGEPGTEDGHVFTVPKAKASTSSPKVCTSPTPRTHQTSSGSNGRIASQSENGEPVPSIRHRRETNQSAPLRASRNKSKKAKEEAVKRDRKMETAAEEEEEERVGEEEGGWSSDAYWDACYRAWNDYYSSVGPEHTYQSYYSLAQNWMAAYRMNAVYMEELMKH